MNHLFTIILLLTAPIVRAGEFFQELESGNSSAAEKMIPSLSRGSQATQRYLNAQVAFFTHQYDESLKLLEGLPSGKEVDSFKELVTNTREATKNMMGIKTDHFELYYAPGKDEILAVYAKEVVEKIRTAIAQDLGVAPPEKVRVEFYPAWKDFMKVSTLTETEVKTSGTIALCKFNRLMLTTPRALLKGYEWLDTLTHEFTHSMINRATNGLAPVWLHEGIAKYEEVRWRRPSGSEISPSSSYLLTTRLRKGTLIPFEKLHPSIAKLPSQDDVALAFTQVYYFVDYLVSVKGGMGKIQKLLANIKTGISLDEAFAKTYGINVTELNREWLLWLKKQPLGLTAGTKAKPKQLKDDPDLITGETDQTGFQDLPDVKSKNLAKIADRLMEKRRWKAALTEYEKANALTSGSPFLFGKIAIAAVELGDFAKSLQAITWAIQKEPDNVTSYIRRGLIYFRKKEYELAEMDLMHANSINPFDPQIHSALLQIYQSKGEAESANREKMVLKILEP